MNTHVARWKKNFESVQKVIDALPESRDHTSEMHASDKKSLTLSETKVMTSRRLNIAKLLKLIRSR